MYPYQNEQKPQVNASQSFGAVPMQPPTEEGIASAIKKLIEESHENARLASNLRDTLGIGNPPNDLNKESESSLYFILRTITSRIARSNGDLSETLRHLNS